MYSRIVKWICVAVLVLAAAVTLHGILQILLLASSVAFLASIRYVKPMPRMALATITDLPARGESL